MSAFELTGKTPEGKTGKVWGCGACLIAHRTEEDANRCCAPVLCQGCNDEVPSGERRWNDGTVYCRSCFDVRSQERDAERIAKAPRVLESETEMLYCDCCEEFFATSDDLLDDHYSHDRDLPEYAWACDKVTFHLDAGDVLESRLEQLEFADGTEFETTAIKELQTALDAWCSRYAEVNFFANNSIIDLTKPREAWLLLAKTELALERSEQVHAEDVAALEQALNRAKPV